IERQLAGVALTAHGRVPARYRQIRRLGAVETRGQLAGEAQLDVARVERAGVDPLPQGRRFGDRYLEAQQVDPAPHQHVVDLHRLVDDVDRRLVDAGVVAHRLAYLQIGSADVLTTLMC